MTNINSVGSSCMVVNLKPGVRTKLTCGYDSSMLIEKKEERGICWYEALYYLNDDIIIAIFNIDSPPCTLFPGGLKINIIDLS